MSFLIIRYAVLGSLVAVMRCQGTPQLVILVADHGLSNTPGALFRLNIHHMNLSVINIPNVLKPVTISYDKPNNHIYWTDVSTKQVRRANIDGENDVIVANLSSTSSPEGLTLDSITRQIFYTDQGNDVIVRIEMGTFQSTEIVNTGLDRPRAIVSDNTNRKLYWVDFGTTEKIETCDYYGNVRRSVVQTGLIAPNGITLDEKAGRLFWTDGAGWIESVLVDGTDRKRIQSYTNASLNGIYLFNGQLYFTGFQNSAVHTLTEDGDHYAPLTSQRFQDPGGISVFSPNINNTSSCPYGQYGMTCVQCGKCSGGSPCEKTTGVCLSGCEPGYKGDMCMEECDPGTYGKDCKSVCSIYCKPGSICDHATGHCTDGCAAGRTGNNCTTSCPYNTYGPCTPCGRCAGDALCDTVSGYCPGVCDPGWTGDKCDAACPYNTYGPCTPCGHCAGGALCDTVSSYCPGGCQRGWTGLKCDNEHNKEPTDNEDGDGDKQNIPIGLIVGIAAGVAVAVIVAIVVVVVVIVRKQRTSSSNVDPYVEFDNRNKEENVYATLENIDNTNAPGRQGTVGEAYS